MGHYDIDYSGMAPQEAHRRCIEDIKEWLGDRKYRSLTLQLRRDYADPGLRVFARWAAMAGVQGRPVRAWHDEIWPFG